MEEVVNNEVVYEKVETVGQLIRGVTYKKEDASSVYREGYLPILRATNINGELNFEDLVYVPQQKIKSDQLIRKGDIIFAMSSGSKHLVGKSAVALADFNGSYGAFCACFRPSEKIDKTYCAYFFRGPSYKRLISEIAKGTNINNLKREHILGLTIPLPSKHHQQQIVSKIEELFSELDKGVEGLKVVQQQLKVYRQAVLKWAFEGRLTNDNVKDGELPEGWELVTIEEVSTILSGQAFKSESFLSSGKYQVVRMGNVRPGILRLNEQPVFINEVEQKILTKSKLEIGDVIITLTGTRNKRDYGFTTMIKKPDLLLNQRIAGLRFYENYLPQFFLYFSWTDEFKNQFFAMETGNVGQGNVGMNAVRKTKIPFPSITEQAKVVQEIESRLSVCDKIEETITNSLKEAEALRQSILKRAFEGRLV